jgi:NAD(P)-dependent dehydrogenase (short-subunit alcohol dehydrogenase family)
MTNTGKQNENATLIVGASSAIAQAIVKQLNEVVSEKVYSVSRAKLEPIDGVASFQSDYSSSSIESICQQIRDDRIVPSKVIVCNGLLHNDDVFPEKQLREFTEAKWLATMQANALVPMLWLQAVAGILPPKAECKIAVFSARVGSISDNRLGGWYSYRSSKAALNMLVKTASLEMKRTHPNVGLMLFHPGTTDTPLSKPFQQRVPEGKLFTPEFVAEKLLGLMEQKMEAGSLKYLDWAGNAIEF